MDCAEPVPALLLRGVAPASERFEALLRRCVPALDVTADPKRALDRAGDQPPPIVAVDWSAPDAAAAFCAEARALAGGQPGAFLLAVTERPLDLPGIVSAGADDFLLTNGDDAAAKCRMDVVRARFARELAARRALAQTQARLVDVGRMATVGTLAAGVAHEINNPLAFVITNIDAALRRLGLMEQRGQGGRLLSWSRSYTDARPAPSEVGEVLRLLEDAREGAERVRLIVRDLRTFSRGEAERRGPVDVARVLDACVQMAMNEIRHRAKIARDFVDVPPVEANESRLAQVFLNLIVNAAQAIPEGRADENEIALSTRLDAAGRVVVEVRDTGVGIAPEQLEHVFDPFYTSKPAGEGLGLGLAICRDIVSALGGSIEVESRPGQGSAFRVVLPVSRRGEVGTLDAAVAAPAPSSRARASVARRQRVLIVDDEPLLARAIAGTLEPEHETVEAKSARDALARIGGGERFDVILCDLMMPDMTGMDLYDALGEVAPEQQRRVVFLTGGAFTERGRAFLERVNARLLVKPFDAATLLSMVDEVVASA